MALAAATAITGQRKVLVFDGAYHGAVLNFASGKAVTNIPHDFIIGSYNDIDGTRALLAQHGSECAAILVEPMLGAGGCVPADTAFLEMLRSEASRHRTVLIFDEVMTSRLSPGGLQEATGVFADLTTLGKYIGGGMSFGAFGGKSVLMERFDPSRPNALAHAGTFNNNVLTMCAGYAGLTEVYTPEAATRLSETGDAFRAELNALCASRDVAMQFTGLGSLGTVHFSRSAIRCGADVRAASQALKELFFFDMLEAGVYLARRGMYALSLEITADDRALFRRGVERFIEERGVLLA